MERLTVNKSVSEMNMVELAHNCCYISEGGNANYRDFQTDIDAREFTRRLMRIYDDENLSEGDTEFDEEIMTELKYDPEIYPSALIALFYRNLWAMAELREKLKHYEDAEEQGLLAKVVCGEWIDHGTLNDYPEKGMNNYHLLVCSECGCCHRTRLQDNIGKLFNANFCPNCGAKMQKLAELKGV